ncbi:hypothetical protein GIB67_026504 [Kingdonia uniflora]|uniref:Uncharacterized protein n=1 Tax=Kingdonia uniflora TaxID=39325 RepID=A0A7J7PBK9_9MAGN|nr:hypothetical protein GIB67_026504 [Kingdonia uniflora]
MFDTASKETSAVLEGPVNDLPLATTSGTDEDKVVVNMTTDDSRVPTVTLTVVVTNTTNQEKGTLSGVHVIPPTGVLTDKGNGEFKGFVIDIVSRKDTELDGERETRKNYFHIPPLAPTVRAIFVAGLTPVRERVAERRPVSDEGGTGVPHNVWWSPLIVNLTGMKTPISMFTASPQGDLDRERRRKIVTCPGRVAFKPEPSPVYPIPGPATILNWMQSKLSGRQATTKATGGSISSKHHTPQEPRKDEFSDWPHGLLAIGTFGSNDTREDSQKLDQQERPPSSDDQIDFTPEEVGKLQKELTKLLSRKPKESEGDGINLPLDKFLNCPSSLEVDRTNCRKFCDDSDEDLRRITSVILNKGKDLGIDGNNAINKKSVSFLLKKMFVCASGFGPVPSLRDPIPETRMEKLLRTILNKKIYPQRPSTTSSKKFIENRHSSKVDKEDKIKNKGAEACKWVKTDSEYIVLEI